MLPLARFFRGQKHVNSVPLSSGGQVTCPAISCISKTGTEPARRSFLRGARRRKEIFLSAWRPKD